MRRHIPPQSILVFLLTSSAWAGCGESIDPVGDAGATLDAAVDAQDAGPMNDGGAPDSPDASFDAGPPSDDVMPSLVASRVACVAPCGVTFDATDSTASRVERPVHDLRFDWDFGDPTAQFENNPSADATKARGGIAGHVFAAAGTYEVVLTVTATDGRFGTQTAEIVVRDAEEAYAGATVCVSSSSNFDECPTDDPSQQFTNMDEAFAVFTQAGPSRLLIHAGERLPIMQTHRIRSAGPHLLGRYGEGDDPELVTQPLPTDAEGRDALGTGFLEVLGADDVTVTGVAIVGPYDPMTGNGERGRAFFADDASHFVLYRVRIVGPSIGTHFSGESGASNLLADIHMSNWENYGVLGSPGRAGAIIGSSLRQHPDAVSGDEAKLGGRSGNTPDHGPIRISDSIRVAVAQNDLFSSTGWSSGGLGIQPCLRLGTNENIERSFVYDNRMEGGFGIISMENANDDIIARSGDVVIERNRLIAGSGTGDFVHASTAGFTLRNNLLLKPFNGGPAIGAQALDSVVRIQMKGHLESLLAEPIRIEHNTVLSIEEAACENLTILSMHGSGAEPLPVPTHIEVFGNIVWAPFADGTPSVMRISSATPRDNIRAGSNVFFAPTITDRWLRLRLSSAQNDYDELTLEAWMAEGHGEGSTTMEPLLTDPGAFDASPSGDLLGVPRRAGIQDDFNGTLRATEATPVGAWVPR